MKPLAATLLATLLALFLTVPTGARAASGELNPKAGTSWQADRAFEIAWDPVAPPSPTKAAYRIYNSRAQPIITFRRSLDEMLKDIEVPPAPDSYLLEAWLENEAGEEGRHSIAVLRFDDSAPPAPDLDAPSGWDPGTEPVVVRVARSSAPVSPAGIRGYAISLDRGTGSSPCAQPGHCRSDEIDVSDGEGGSLSLGTLPEGVHFFRAVAVSGAGVPSPVVTAVIRIDGSAPVVSLAGAPGDWGNGPVQVTARSSDPLSGMQAAGGLGPFTAIAVDGAPPTRALGDGAEAWVTGSGSHAVQYFARDAAGNLSETGTATVRIDEDPPRIAFAAAQDPAEPERIEATVGDSLSGPSPDNGSIAVRLSGTRARFEPLPTRNAGDRLVAHWDSDSYPSGKYEFLATAYDVAGNYATGTDRARGGRMVLVNPLKTQVELTAGLSRRRLGGHLRRVGGGPLAGQDVVVTETFAAGSQPRQRTTVVGTDGRGAFSLHLKPGPSRDVVARFAGTALLSRATSGATHLEAATKVRLHSSAATARIGGRPVVFTGKVAHRGAATVAGLPVELQFRFRGGAWSEFRTVEADRRGRFHYRYRFSDDDSRGVRFQFRAYVKGREGWPYGPGTSRPVKVTGR